MAIYGTDLVTLTNAESGVWTELASPYNAGGTPALDNENYIQGVDCYSQTTGTKSGLVFSIVWDNGSPISIATDDVFLLWSFYAVGANLNTYASGGMRVVIAADISNADAWAVGGSDFARNPYGGWMNVAVDPTITADYTINSGNGGSYQFFGTMPNTLAAISKGTPHAVDAIRQGRGEIYCISTGCTFTGMAIANDLNTATAFTGDTTNTVAQITNISDVSQLIVGMEVTGTNIPAATTITAVTGTTATISNAATGTAVGTSFSQYNRLGLFQDNGGTFLWKGLMSFGQTGTSCTFSDSNQTIIIDDTTKCFATFNKVEINNASSSVTWNNISFTALGTTSPGYFEMIDNATVLFTGCTFNQMTGTHIYQSNASVLACAFNSCGKITAGGADFSGTSVLTSAVPADEGALLWNSATDPNTYLDGMEFSKGTNAHHAIEFGTAAPATMTLTDIAFGTSWNASDENNDSTLLFPDTGGDVTWTVNLVGCTGTITYKRARNPGDTVNLVINPVTALVHVEDPDGNNLQNARVYLRASDGTGPMPYMDSVSITRSGTTATVDHTAHGMATSDKVKILGITDKTEDNNGVHTITVTGVDTYTYTTTDSGSVSYTGTITSTWVAIEELTDANGDASKSKSLTGNQPVEGWVRKSSSSPRYKTNRFNGTINSTNGVTFNLQMIDDE